MGTGNTAEDIALVRGTLNVVLGNREGVVAMTDSMQTVVSATGQTAQLREPGKKLFQLDAYTACTIAGFGSASLPSAPEFNASAAGIIERYAEELTRQPFRRASFREKLSALSFLFEYYLTTIATITLLTHGQRSPDASSYTFELILAGYDDDLKPKIGRLSIRGTTVQVAGDSRIRAETWRLTTRAIEDDLTHELAGQPAIAAAVIKDPNKMRDPAVQSYAASMTADHGRSLTLDKLVAFGDALVGVTARAVPSVGGERQIAVLRGGRVQSLRGPRFQRAKAPMTFSLMSDSTIAGGRTAVAPGSSVLFVRSVLRQTAVPLDGNYFFGSRLEDCEVRYDGGVTRLDTTNEVNNCTLVLGPQAQRGSARVQQLLGAFQWKLVKDEVVPVK